jgi:outer membrane protein assembly factor BamA
MVSACVFAVIIAAGVDTDAQAPGSAYQLSAVRVTGIRRYSQEHVARLSGLEPGQTVSVAQVASAAERLASSGLFKGVKYRYTMAAGRMNAIFEVEEAEWSIPVMFDNFIWFTDAEPTTAIARDVPTFDRTLPAGEGAPDLVMRSLQKLLEARKIAGRAAFQPQTDLKEKKLRYLFKVEEPAPVLCGINFEGVSAAQERELVAAARPALGKEYSRFYISSLAAGTLLDVYHRRGYWRASFAAPTPVPDSPACQGVVATLPVTEGAVYAFDKARWNGNHVLAAAELDTAFGMKPGEVADSSKIDAGLIAVRRAYGKHGYLMVEQATAPALDDTTRRAAFDISVEEGPQFFMGTLQFAGVSDADAKRLAKNWKLAAGEPFDDSYTSGFITREVIPLLPSGTRPPLTETSAGSEKHLVNVKIVFQR